MNVEMAVQGKVVGVIIPPPDIRAVVDKTAQFVARNGKSFEQRILASSEGQTAKFNFMKAFDPYHAYYEMKIREVEEGKPIEVALPSSSTANDSVTKNTVNESKGTSNTTTASNADGKGTSQTLQPSVSTTVKASIMNPIAQLAKVKPTEAPPAFEFIIAHPTGLTASDVDIIKLTAQYTAINGREFLTGLVLREQRNPQFDFLKPTHMLFSYFTSLVDSYAKIVTPSTVVRERIRENAVFKSAMENSVKRWMWNRAEEERTKKESSAADEERLAFQAIDWFDFTVVETIDFPVDELFDLPGLSSMGMDDRAPSLGSQQLIDPSYPHTDTGNLSSGKDFDASYFAPSQQEVDVGAEVEMLMEMDAMQDTEDMSDLKVVPDYEFVPANKRSSGAGGSAQMMIDPISGKAVPIDQMTEHMRIQLLDPKWRQQQKVFMEKQKETGYAEGVSIADSLKQFARKRGDIFGQAASGSGPNSAAAIAEQEAADRKKQEVQIDVIVEITPHSHRLDHATHTDQEPSSVGWTLWKHRLSAAGQVRLGIKGTHCIRSFSYQCASSRDWSDCCVGCEYASTAIVVIYSFGACRLTSSTSDAYDPCPTPSPSAGAAASPSTSSPSLQCSSSKHGPSLHVSTHPSLFIWGSTASFTDGV